MTNSPYSKLIHSLLFHVFWGAILYFEFYSVKYKVALISVTSLIFLAIHFISFTKNFKAEFIFTTLAFVIGFTVETVLSSLNIYHYGIVDYPGLSWPPPWMAALWLIFPPFISYCLDFLNKLKIIGAFIAAGSTFGTYYFLGKKLDLIFFQAPLGQNILFFVLTWYLLYRGLFWLKDMSEKHFQTN